MSFVNTRIRKEVRALFWPWCAVVSAVCLQWLPWLSGSRIAPMRDTSLLAFWVGISLLATISLGDEFQYRTLPLLLSQPIDRRKLWAEKWLVLLVAILSASFVHWFCGPVPFSDDGGLGIVLGAAAISVCSAMFWTLVARSTIGGLIFSALQGIFILSAARMTYSFLGPKPSPDAVTTVSIIEGVTGVCFGLAMLWLGRRKLARFQATGETAGNDMLMASSAATGGFLSAWLRPRPTRPLLNLIRKEVRLLWPAWLLTLVVVLFLLCVAPFRHLPNVTNSLLMSASVVALFIVALATLLAGSVSLGEETTLGMRSSYMTTPVSVRKHWLTKLLMAQLASTICALVFVVAGQSLLGSSFLFAGQTSDLLMGASFVCFIAFWCSSAVKGTVRAVLWVFPTTGAILGATSLGVFLAQRLLANSLDFIISRFHPYPFTRSTETIINEVLLRRFEVLLATPVLLLMIIQSYRLFRTEPRDSVFSPVRYLLPAVVVVFLTAFSHQLPFAIMTSARVHTWKTLGEVSNAVARMPLDTKKLDAGQPLQLTLEDVARVSPISDATRRSLNDTVTVTPQQISHRRWDRRNGQSITEKFSYFSTVRLRNDWSCSMYGTEPMVFSCTPPSGPRWGFPTFP